MKDLFSANQEFERVEMPDADVSILRDLMLFDGYDRIFERLRDETVWQQQEMRFYGKPVLQPRLTAWYGDPERTYIYSGIRNIPLPWTNLLLSLRRCVEEVCECTFNSVLLNYYRSGNDSMGFHSDNERELGPMPVIASLSLGEARVFVFKHSKRNDLPAVRVPLKSGTLLLMKGPTQRFWKHAINKERPMAGGRINLTFRHIYTAHELDELDLAGRGHAASR
jgi:alkylated DNA repair dioxygenase AlkB